MASDVLTLPGMGRRSLGRWILTPALALVTLVAISGIAVVVAHRDFRANNETRARQSAVLSEGFGTLKAVLDAETAVRGFLLTGDRRSLAPWRRSTSSFSIHARQLHALEPDDKTVLRYVDGAAAYLDGYARPAIDAEMRRLRRPGAATPRHRVALVSKGRLLVDRLRAQYELVLATERGEIARDADRAGERAARTELIAMGAIVLAALLALGTGLIVARHLVRPLGRMRAAARRLAEGEYATRLRSPKVAELCQLAQVFNHLGRALQERDETIRGHTAMLEDRVAERTAELEAAHIDSLRRLAIASEYRDDDTFEHTERVGTTAEALGRRLGLDTLDVRILRQAAPLHDIGKLGVPDRILHKPGPLDDDERAAMQWHTDMGGNLLAGSSSEVMQMGEIIARTHHERWDGEGYPRGLAGEAIPLVGRIVAVADVFDALTHDRPYKEAWPVERAIEHIEAASGTHFDPAVVEAFTALREEEDSPLQVSMSPSSV